MGEKKGAGTGVVKLAAIVALNSSDCSVILDDCSHYLWTFPLRLKSDTFSTLTNFFSFVHTQFDVTIRGIQCDK